MGYLTEDEELTVACFVLGVQDAKRTGVEHQNISIKNLEEIESVMDKMHDVIESLEKKVEDQEERIAIMTEGGWISVDERLPKSMANKVLVWLEHDDLIGQIAYGHYEKYDGEETWYDLEHLEPFSDRGYRVTHWMETPEPPNEGETE